MNSRVNIIVTGTGLATVLCAAAAVLGFDWRIFPLAWSIYGLTIFWLRMSYHLSEATRCDGKVYRWSYTVQTSAQGIEAGTDETPQEVRPEGQEPDGAADAPTND